MRARASGALSCIERLRRHPLAREAVIIWLRKIEVSKVEIKASHVYEIEMEREGECPFGPASTLGEGMAGRFVVK